MLSLANGKYRIQWILINKFFISKTKVARKKWSLYSYSMDWIYLESGLKSKTPKDIFFFNLFPSVIRIWKELNLSYVLKSNGIWK